MSRKGNIKPRNVEPDSVFNNKLVSKLINRSMIDGKKSVSVKQVYGAFAKIEEVTKKNGVKVYEEAIDNIKPSLEVRPRRVGGAAYQVPMPVRGSRKETLAIRWLVNAARARQNSEYHTYADKLAAEIIDAAKNEGGAIKKRLDSEKMAEANRAFAHFKW